MQLVAGNIWTLLIVTYSASGTNRDTILSSTHTHAQFVQRVTPFDRAPQIYTTLRAQGTYTNGIYSMCIMYSGQRGSSSTDRQCLQHTTTV